MRRSEHTTVLRTRVPGSLFHVVLLKPGPGRFDWCLGDRTRAIEIPKIHYTTAVRFCKPTDTVLEKYTLGDPAQDILCRDDT